MLVYLVPEPPAVGFYGNVAAFTYYAPEDYVGAVSFAYYAAAIVAGTRTITKFSNTARATISDQLRARADSAAARSRANTPGSTARPTSG